MRRRDSPLSPAAYWRLRFFSPLIMLVGMAAGAVLITRSILVWGVDSDEHQFGPDIPISAAVLVLWVGAVVLLMLPPRGAIALRSGPFDSRRLVWSLGRRFRVWNMIGAPLCGLLVVIAPFAIVTALGFSPGVPANLWFGLPTGVALNVLALALVVLQLRSALHGVELTPTHLVARGYFWTRRYPRLDIVSINAVELGSWSAFLVSWFSNRYVGDTVQLSLVNGKEPLRLASNSHVPEVEAGAEIIRAWRSAEDD